MNNEYLIKTKSVLEDLNKCLNDSQRDGFYEVNSNIHSLMFDGHTLKSEFSMILPNKVSGYFTNMMWNISQTGAYFGSNIKGYSVDNIKKCVDEIVSVLDQEILKTEQIEKNDFHTNILTACSLMQTNLVYHDRKDRSGNDIIVEEDHRNYYIRDLLDFKGLYVRGQEHQGTSPKGGGAGEVDLLICRTELQSKIYLEGMNLSSVEKSKIAEHYEKLFLYDASGNKNNYLLSYVKVGDFNAFCKKYKDYFEGYNGKTKCEKIAEIVSDYANIKILLSESRHKENKIFTYHILILFEQY